ncbi:MAG: hypothetical protein Q9218_006270, partial [Villophora microphyllina]
MSPHYSTMLLAQAFMQLLRLWDASQLEMLDNTLIQNGVCRVLIQILNRTLFLQNANGTWSSKDPSESDAYCLLTLLALDGLPLVALLAMQTRSAIHTGRQALSLFEPQWAKPHYIWVEKVTFGSQMLAESYCLAAMNAPFPTHQWKGKIEKIAGAYTQNILKLSLFFHSLPEYSTDPHWMILASVMEGYSYHAQLKQTRSEVFPHQKSAKDTYLEYVPCSWTIINNRFGLFLNSTLLWDMMVVSVLDYLIDEYVESIGGELSEGEADALRHRIPDLFAQLPADSTSTALLHSTVTQSPVNPANGNELGTDLKYHISSRRLSGNAGSKQLTNGDTMEQAQAPKPTKESNFQESTETNGHIGTMDDTQSLEDRSLPVIEQVLVRFITVVLDHPRIRKASSSDRSSLSTELQRLIIAHIDQIRDNARFQHQLRVSPAVTKVWLWPGNSHYIWAHTTGAVHTTCAFSFQYYLCLLGHSAFGYPSPNIFDSAYTKYLAGDLCTHLAVMSRLYNDYGSVLRDDAESNINSINFPEFHRLMEN